jgi:hypothetical protein
MAWRYKEWGGIRKAETEVVRIKGRRRDKGGGGRVGEANQQGGRINPLILRFLCFIIDVLILATINYLTHN